ncbi:MAG: hypothetical protein ACI9UO_000234 [Nitrospinales bacterium]|jgi:hypothetical protein
MVEVIKLYLLGILVMAPGIADQNAVQIAKAQSEQPTVIVRMPSLNNYKTCLHSAKKQFTHCATKTDKSIKRHTKSATSIFKKQRICSLEKERNHSRCKSIFLK